MKKKDKSRRINTFDVLKIILLLMGCCFYYHQALLYSCNAKDFYDRIATSHNFNSKEKSNLTRDEKRLYLYNFPTSEEQQKRNRNDDPNKLVASLLTCQILSNLNENTWRTYEWTTQECHHTFIDEFASFHSLNINFAQSVKDLTKLIPEWAQCSSLNKYLFTKENFTKNMNLRLVTPPKICDCDISFQFSHDYIDEYNDEYNDEYMDKHEPNYENAENLQTNTSIQRNDTFTNKVIVIESHRKGHWNVFHDLVIDYSSFSWCIFSLFVRYLTDPQVTQIIIFEPQTFRTKDSFSFSGSLMHNLYPLVLHFTDRNQYNDYITYNISNTTDVKLIQGRFCFRHVFQQGMTPSFDTYYPNVKPFHQMIKVAETLKNITFAFNKTTLLLDSSKNKDRLMEECNDCVLLIQRDATTRRLAGSNTGTFTEIVIELLKLNFPVQLVTLEGITAAQQMKLFHNARVVVGMHGAGLTNLVWMRSNYTGIVEVIPNHGWHAEINQMNSCRLHDANPFYSKFEFFNLAKLANIHHDYIHSEYSTPFFSANTGHYRNPITKNIYYVDAVALAKKVKEKYNFLKREEKL